MHGKGRETAPRQVVPRQEVPRGWRGIMATEDLERTISGMTRLDSYARAITSACPFLEKSLEDWQ